MKQTKQRCSLIYDKFTVEAGVTGKNDITNSTTTSTNYIKKAVLVTLEENAYSSCFIGKFGGLWRIEDTLSITESKSTYEYMAALYGACLSASNATIKVVENTYSKN